MMLVACGFAWVGAQPAPVDSTWRNQAPRLYLQDVTSADVDYIKTEITFVNYVRDPKDADIHLTISYSITGSGGYEYTLDFLGRGSFKDIRFVLRHTTKADATSDEIRTALVAAIKRGLAPFIYATALRNNLAVDFKPPVVPTAVRDVWRSWVFTLYASSQMQGEECWRCLYYYLNADASRTTELTKFDLYGGTSVNSNRYVLDSSVLYAATRSSWVDVSDSRKLSNHLALAGGLGYSNDVYSNVRLGLNASTPLEYCITPYSEYAKHKVYVRYIPSLKYRQYYDTTVYGKMSDLLFQNSVQAGVTATRRWGTAFLYAVGSAYLPDVSKDRLTFLASVNLRITAGLSLNLGGDFILMNDQLSLRKKSPTEEEQLLQLRELKSGYSYYAFFGLNYTFGSIYSNIVNPIF